MHDETRLTDSDIANVYVLECGSGAVDIDVQVRWPKNSWETLQQQIVKLHKVSRIKRSVESTTNIKITDSVIYIDGKEIEDEEKSLAHYHCVSDSLVKLIIVKYRDSPPYLGMYTSTYA